jgi:hypothetical protein
MKKKFLKAAGIGMLTCGIIVGANMGIRSFAAYDESAVINNISLTLSSIEAPEDVKEYAKNVTGKLMSDVYDNEEGFGVKINDYSKLTLGQPFTVMSQSDEVIYSFPVIEEDEIKLILNVFKDGDMWNASLGKNYADKLNELQENKDERYLLCVEEGNVVAKSEDKTLVMEVANYDYISEEVEDFSKDATYDEIINTVEENTSLNVEEKKVTDTFMDSEDITKSIAKCNEEFSEEYKSFIFDIIKNWWEKFFPGNDSWDDWNDDSWDDGSWDDWNDDSWDDWNDDNWDDGNWDDIVVTFPPVTCGPVDPQPVDPVDPQPVETVIPEETASPVNPVEPVTPDNIEPGSGIGAYSDKPFLVDTDGAKTLNTEGCNVLQQDKNGIERGLCWAATTATIVNYRSGKKQLEAYDVADYMHIGYDNGGTLYDIQNALSHYGFEYSAINQPLSMQAISEAINDKKPICMCAYSFAGGHAVTLVGYTSDTITLWNSGNHQMQTCTYSQSGTSFVYAGYRFTWQETVTPK